MKLSSPLIALEFLTPLRLRRVQQWDDLTFGAALAWYPAVGLLMGGLLLLIDRGLQHLLPVGPTAALLVAMLALLSGGLHLDGVADTADGMALQGDRAERLGVMSEGNIGPAGVMALVIVLLVLWTGLASMEAPVRSAGLLLIPIPVSCVIRSSILQDCGRLRPTRSCDLLTHHRNHNENLRTWQPIVFLYFQ